jgi:hypothetical protein
MTLYSLYLEDCGSIWLPAFSLGLKLEVESIIVEEELEMIQGHS